MICKGIIATHEPAQEETGLGQAIIMRLAPGNHHGRIAARLRDDRSVVGQHRAAVSFESSVHALVESGAQSADKVVIAQGEIDAVVAQVAGAGSGAVPGVKAQAPMWS